MDPFFDVRKNNLYYKSCIMLLHRLKLYIPTDSDSDRISSNYVV